MWLRTDEREDFLTSLSECLRSLKVVNDEAAAWKWAVLSLHNALQGAMVCHLSGTANIGGLGAKAARAWLEWHERDRQGKVERTYLGTGAQGIPQYKIKNGQAPSDRLADAAELFARLYDGRRRQEAGAGAILEIQKSQQDAFARLHDLRNNFSHFTPKGWSLELSGLPNVFLEILEVLRIISEDPWPFRHMDTQQHARLEKLLADLRIALVELCG